MSARAGGDPVAYPPELPDGWFATSAAFGVKGIWSLSLLTDEEHFVGVRQSRAPSPSTTWSRRTSTTRPRRATR